MKTLRVLLILFVLIILISLFILLKIPSFQQPKNITKEEAIRMINSSLLLSYPNARIEFVSVNSSLLHPGYFAISVVVAQNPNSPCPQTFVLEYDTFYGLDWKVQNNLTRDCIVFGAQNNPNYIYGRREEAMSRASQFEETKNFIKNCNQGIYVDAFATQLNSTKVWDVVYFCNKTRLDVFITQKGGELLKIISSQA